MLSAEPHGSPHPGLENMTLQRTLRAVEWACDLLITPGKPHPRAEPKSGSRLHIGSQLRFPEGSNEAPMQALASSQKAS